MSQQAPDPADEGPLSAEQIALFCEQLGAADFDVREEAMKKLIAKGKTGIDQVAAAAEAGSLEVAMRAIKILADFFRQPDAAATAAAGTALAKLSESKNRSVARRANNIIRPPDSAATQRQQVLIGRANRRVVGGIAVNVVGNQIVAGGGMRVNTTNNNGDVTIDAEEDGRKVVITHRNAQNIVVRVTEAPAAGEKTGKTTEYKAKDLDELKAKHPEAHSLFEKHTEAVWASAGSSA